MEGIIDPTVASEVSGKITKIYVRPGMQVNKGQLMAEVDPSDTSYQLSLSDAEVKKLKARLNNQKINYDRNLKLVDENFISPNALETLAVQIEETQEELNDFEPFSDDPVWEVLYTGVGKVNAAIKTTEILKDLSPSETIVINFGSAGSSDYKIGELIKCLQFQQGDIDTKQFAKKYVTPFDDIIYPKLEPRF